MERERERGKKREKERESVCVVNIPQCSICPFSATRMTGLKNRLIDSPRGRPPRGLIQQTRRQIASDFEFPATLLPAAPLHKDTPFLMSLY